MSPFQPFQFDESITRIEEAGTKVRPGEYLLEIMGSQPTDEDHDGPPGVYWKVKIDKGPDGIGKPMRHFTTFKQDVEHPEKSGQFGVGRLLFVCGYDPTKLVGKGAQTYEQFKQLVEGMTKGLVGHKFGGSIDDDTYNGRVFSKIFSIYPEADYEERAKTNDLPRTTPPPNGTLAGTPPAPIDMAQFNANVDKMFSETVETPTAPPAGTGFTLE